MSIPVGALAGSVFALGMNLVGVVRVKSTILRGVRFRPTRKAARYLLRDSTALLSVPVAGLVGSRLLGVVIAVIVSTPAVVVFDVTRKAVVLVSDIAMRIPLSLLPGLSHLYGTGERDRATTVVAILFRAIVVVGAAGFGIVAVVNGSFVFLWTGPAQFGGTVLTACLCAAALTQLMNGSAFQVLVSMGETGVLPVAAWIEAVSTLLFAIVLGHAFGLPGIAAATMLSASASLAIQGRTLIRRLSSGGRGGVFRGSVPRLAVALFCPVVVGVGMGSFWVPSTWRGLAGFAAVAWPWGGSHAPSRRRSASNCHRDGGEAFPGGRPVRILYMGTIGVGLDESPAV